jgi:bifunctional N-acetylglucosamine-1-phosphate-uridyltransferase/glucosamine-1-phosphate-acetyltransferase GlmU-like protein
MGSDLPKVLHQLRGKPLLHHVIEAVQSAGIDRVIVVVGYRGDDVVASLPHGVEHVWQHDQLGTGHAVKQAREVLSGWDGPLLVACGDVPLIRAETFRTLLDSASPDTCGASVLTMRVTNPGSYGRIIRNSGNGFVRIVEARDASPEELSIDEVNTGTYVFRGDLLFPGLDALQCNNAQNEYYLPDVLSYIRDKGFSIAVSVLVDPVEGSGVNTPEELDMLSRYTIKK